jgi:hypothetical protein
LRIRIRTKAPPLQQRLNPLAHERRHAENILILGRRQLVKFRTAIGAGCVNSVNHEAMEVWVAIQGISHAPAREAGVRPTESTLLRDLALSRVKVRTLRRQIQSSFPRLCRFSQSFVLPFVAWLT